MKLLLIPLLLLAPAVYANALPEPKPLEAAEYHVLPPSPLERALEAAFILPPVDRAIHAGDTPTTIQNAINASVSGDTITVDVATYNLPNGLNLPIHSGTCTGAAGDYATIRSAELASIPAPTTIGFRPVMGSTIYAHMPKFVTTSGSNGDPVFYLANNAGCWKLQGLEITNNTTTTINVMIRLGEFGTGAHVILDRLYFHPKENPPTLPYYNTTGRYAVQANITDLSIINSDIVDFKGLYPGVTASPDNGPSPVDTVGILIDVGPCNPCLFQNNYINTWYNPIFFGGADPTASLIATVSASTLTQATLSTTSGLSVGMKIAFKIPWQNPPLYCNGNDATHDCWADGKVTNIAGSVVTYTALIVGTGSSRLFVPAGLEPVTGGTSKAVWQGPTPSNVSILNNHFYISPDFAAWERINSNGHNNPKSFMEIKMCESCLIEGNTFDGFASTPLGIASYNQNGGSPWTHTANLIFRNNWTKKFTTAFYLPLADSYYLNTDGGPITITNNFWETPDINGTDSGRTSEISSAHNGTAFTVTHNTILLAYPSNYSTGALNLQSAGALYYRQPDVIWKDNLFGQANNGYQCSEGAVIPTCWNTLTETNNYIIKEPNPPDGPLTSLFPNSTFLVGWSSIQFTNAAGSVFSLTPTSPGHNAASDGTDVGVNWANMLTALGGVSPPVSTTASTVRGGKTTAGGKTIFH